MKLFQLSLITTSILLHNNHVSSEEDRCGDGDCDGYGSRNKYCRGRRLLPHQQGLWDDGFPETNDLIYPLCEGNITVSDSDGTICVDGRVSYRQLAKELDMPIFGPAAESISVTGHMVSGSGNVVLGSQAFFLYDFISSYTINGTSYDADSNMTNNLLAASMGAIDGVCFDSSYMAGASSWYQTEHKTFSTSSLSSDELNTANLIFAGPSRTVAEYHTSLDAEPSMPVQILSAARMKLFDITASFPTPQFVYDLVPVFENTGLLRRLLVGSGSFSTEQFPQPLTAPDAYVENIQLDAPWDNLMTVMVDGVFTNMPGFMGSVIKRIQSSDSSHSCWKSDTAAIDLQMPVGKAGDLDDFAVNTLYPALAALGDVGLHFGKRLPSGTALMDGALTKYSSCDVEMDLTPDVCYHPACTRSSTVSSFEYPAAYFSNEGPSRGSSDSDSDSDSED